MKRVFIFLIILFVINKCKTENFTLKLICQSNINCGYPNGQCLLNECICSKGWITINQSGCTYKLKSKLIAFLLSFFVGFFGADWFYLSIGNPAYIICGIIKLITFGGLGIWWIVDWIRLLANAFPDGNGFQLEDWNN